VFWLAANEQHIPYPLEIERGLVLHGFAPKQLFLGFVGQMGIFDKTAEWKSQLEEELYEKVSRSFILCGI
jgi:hypothetical protein